MPFVFVSYFEAIEWAWEMDNVSWLFLVILTLTCLLHKEVLSGDYIIDIGIKLNERRIKYGGRKVKKKKERKEDRK
jgi:hypothetical protein